MRRRCELCGAAYAPKTTQQKYCSPECSHRAKRLNQHDAYLRNKEKREQVPHERARQETNTSTTMNTCLYCKRKFTLGNNNITTFCSTECREAYAQREKAARQKRADALEETRRRLDAKEKEARARGCSYGELQRLKYIEECKRRREAGRCKT